MGSDFRPHGCDPMGSAVGITPNMGVMGMRLWSWVLLLLLLLKGFVASAICVAKLAT